MEHGMIGIKTFISICSAFLLQSVIILETSPVLLLVSIEPVSLGVSHSPHT